MTVQTNCAEGRHNIYPAPASWPLTFCPWKWCPSHVWHGLPANFGLSRPLCSRLRPDIRDRQTSDVRRASSLDASALWGHREEALSDDATRTPQCCLMHNATTKRACLSIRLTEISSGQGRGGPCKNFSSYLVRSSCKIWLFFLIRLRVYSSPPKFGGEWGLARGPWDEVWLIPRNTSSHRKMCFH